MMECSICHKEINDFAEHLQAVKKQYEEWRDKGITFPGGPVENEPHSRHWFIREINLKTFDGTSRSS